MNKRWSSGAPVHVLHVFSTAAAAAAAASAAAAAAAAAAAGGAVASFCTYSLQKILFIFRLMIYADVCFFSLSGVLFPRE